jgi:hypothetical protein
LEEIDWNSLTIKGTCTDLEKPYFRLTRVRTLHFSFCFGEEKANFNTSVCLILQIPDPSTIRPEHVLKQSFAMLKEKWREKEDWFYVCEQFKSIRQDLTVLSLSLPPFN